MSYGIDTVKEYAECYVDEGTRDTYEAISGALNQLLFESSLSEGVAWSLFKRVFNSDDVMDNVPEAYERIADYVYRQLRDHIDGYIEDHTYTINFLDVSGEWDEDEEYEDREEFVQAVNDYIEGGCYVLVEGMFKFDPENDIEVTLREVEEDEED